MLVFLPAISSISGVISSPVLKIVRYLNIVELNKDTLLIGTLSSSHVTVWIRGVSLYMMFQVQKMIFFNVILEL